MNETLIAELRHNTAMDAMSKRHRHTDLMAADAIEAADAKLHEQDLRIADLVAHLNAEQAKVEHLVAENGRYRDCRNELCLKCGKYKTAHLGSCDGCRWKEK